MRSPIASDNRGQFLLIGAFGIAVILIAFAGVINTVTYTETLATQDSIQTTSRDVSAFQEDVRQGVDGVLQRVNGGSGDYETKTSRFRDGVDNWENAADKEHMTDVVGVTVTVTGTTNGSSITQSTVRDLTNADGAENWELTDSVPEMRRFRLELDKESLDTADCRSSSCFEFVVDDGASSWQVSVNQYYVRVVGPTSGLCTIDSDPVTIDIIKGTVDGNSCEPLTAIDEASGPYDIAYQNGANASGTYQLVVKGKVDGGDYSDDGDPSLTPFIDSAEYGVRYQTPQLTYANDFRVSGAVPDA
jgi:hypothetical protein